jgi:ribose transport system permease protein
LLDCPFGDEEDAARFQLSGIADTLGVSTENGIAVTWQRAIRNGGWSMATEEKATASVGDRATAVGGVEAEAAPGRFGALRAATSGVKELNILLALIILCAVLAVLSPVFFTFDNLLGVARAFSLTAIAAIGQTMVIITGGIDLSAGSIIGLSSLSTGMLLASGWPSPAAILAGLAVGTAFGVCNGLLITRIGLPPFIATLGTLSIGRGLIYVITKGYPVTAPRDELLLQIGQGYLGRVPMPVVIMVVITIIATAFLGKTTLGRYIYAVGGNEEAARLAGINVNQVKMFVYTVSGFLSAVSGVILLSRLVSAQPSAGLGQELPVIAASIIGGTSLVGGEGTAFGAVLGAAIVGVLENGIVLLGINTYAQQVVTGAAILLAVGIDIWQKRRRQRGV